MDSSNRESISLVNGLPMHIRVQAAGLYDVLANEGSSLWGTAESDIPSLIAAVPFEGATVSRIQPWVSVPYSL